MNLDVPIALTQTVQKGGCAAKVAAQELRNILKQVKFPTPHKELLVDGRYFDDAAIYQISSELAMVQTLDFFTPIVDTPRLFGAVAAANALSDVYAMGGRPKTAMGILAFPIATMSEKTIVEVMQGACDKVAESGANMVGGHSIDDDTLKFGLSVTGFVNPKYVWSNTSAKVGDVLILTKALGTGTMTAGLKRKELSELDIEEALTSMSQINNVIDFLDDNTFQSIHSATDITGFGLSGHSMQMAKASEVTFKFKTDSLPVFKKALNCLERGFLTKAHRTNDEYTKSSVRYSSNISKVQTQILHDPQTSGGLLISVTPSKANSIIEKIKVAFPSANIVGEVIAKSEEAIIFE